MSDLDQKVAHAMGLKSVNDCEKWGTNMKEHFCPVEQSTITYQGKCNWCGELESQEPVAHWSDCAVHSEPAYPKGECDCGGFPPQRTEQEPPKYSFKAHWEKDGRIGVVAAIVRSDGGVHILEDIIDMPQRTWVDLTDEEVFGLFGRFTAMTGKSWLDLYRMTEAKLKQKNGYAEEKNCG